MAGSTILDCECRCDGCGRKPLRIVTAARALACALLGMAAAPCLAQTLRIDAAPEHLTNTLRPTKALGAGVDRLPYGAAQ